jgi:FKBP-type peptidyl-prolyl cis-trans isomerase FklB
MKLKNLIIIAAIVFSMAFTACTNVDSSTVALNNEMDTISYIIGQDYGKNLAEQTYTVNPAAIYKGVEDAINGTSIIPDSVRNAIVANFNQKLELEQQATIKENSIKNKQLGATFLSQMKTQEGVFTLPSGMQYKVLKQGAGKKPVLGDSVTLHYRGTYVTEKDGKFDFPVYGESYGSGPVNIMIDNTVPGLRAGLQMMTPGSIYEFYIPSSLGFGEDGKSQIVPPGVTLVIRVELISVEKA